MSFPMLSRSCPKLLILGSMPGQVSLDRNQYYANPRNVFWWIMSELVPFEMVFTYRERVKATVDANIGIWDVLADCQRPGSLDANIVTESEQPNDFIGLFERCQSIDLIAFNGVTAKRIFMRHFKGLLEERNIAWVLLPSTSSAHAAMSREDKLAIWRTALGPFIATHRP